MAVDSRVFDVGIQTSQALRALAQDAMLQSSVTHGHPRSRVCCALYCLWARYELWGRAEAWEEAVSALEAMFAPPSAERTELDTHIRPREPYPVQSSGYVVDCLHSARWALERGSSYEQVIRLAVSLGNDTDTTACVAGGIAGIRYGLSGIPARWREALRGQALYRHLLEQLADTAS